MQRSSQLLPNAPARDSRRVSWRARSVTTDEGVKLAAFEAGRNDPEAPVVVLVHGLGHWTQGAWEFVAAELEATHRLVSFDLPGFGESAKPDCAYSPAFFVRALEAVVDGLALDRFALVGHSLGGLIAASYASTRPERVRLLALIDPAGFLRTPKLLVRIIGSRAAGALMRSIQPPRRIVRKILETGVYDTASLENWMHERMWELACDPAMTRALVRVYRDSLGEFFDLPRLHARFKRYAGPALIVWGREDRYIPIRALSNARKVYPHAGVHVFERCGHCPPLEYPQALATHLLTAGI